MLTKKVGMSPNSRIIHFDLDNSSTNFWSGQWASKTVPSFRSVPGSNMCYRMVGQNKKMSVFYCNISWLMTIHDNPDVPPMETCRSQELVQHASPHRDFGCKLIWYDFGKLSTLITLMFQTPKRDKKGNWGFRVYNCLYWHIWAVIHPKPRPCFCIIDCISCVESKRSIIPIGKICCVSDQTEGAG